jgi:ABC-type uncharacterized transport system auxiliary subunit
MIRRICFFSLIVWVGLLTGCDRTSLNSQQKSFLLEMSPNPQRLPTPVDGVLKIRYCRAVAPFDNTYFLYRTQSGQYQQDYYRLFLTPPNEQINEYLRAWLEQSGIFRGVLPASSAARADYVLEPQLSALYTDLSDPTQPKTVAKIHVVLLKMDKDYQPSLIITEKTYEHLSPMQNNSSQDIINNYNLCLETILTQLQSDIVSALKKQQNNE